MSDNTDTPSTPRTLPTPEQVAEVMAKAQDADYWIDEIAEWEALEQWERDAHPGEYPGMAYEDRENYRKAADAVLALIDKENTMPEQWCDGCGGPYDDEWLAMYGKHWDTCPNRVMTPKEKIMPEMFRFDAITGEEIRPYTAATGEVRAKIAANVMPGWTPEAVEAAYGAYMSDDPAPDDTIPAPRALIERASRLLHKAAETIDGEWGSMRTVDEIRASGDDYEQVAVGDQLRALLGGGEF